MTDTTKNEGGMPVTDDTFEKLYLESIREEKEIKEGEIVPGKVIQMNSEVVTVDIGFKSEGQIPAEEFKDMGGAIDVEIGDRVDVFLESTEDEHGRVVLSKEKADKLKIWDEIGEVCEKSEVIEGRVMGRVKGGLAVDIGVKAFLPGSQIDLTPVRDLDDLIGKTYQFKIIKFNKLRGNIVLSRRAILEIERDELRGKTLEVLKEGIVMQGVVKNITDYGAFIDLGGIDGLLHITDISWKRINHPSEVLKVADTIDVRVLKYDQEKVRVSLGLKQLAEDPWAEADMKYAKNAKVKGKVVSLTDYGAFIEVEEGVEGLVHVSEMSWTKRVKHPSALLNINDEVEAIVLDIDKENRRMSLGIKQTKPNPWDELLGKYPPGTKINGEVRNVTDFGVFIEVEEDIDGLIHVSDLSWSNKVKNPHDAYKKGDAIEAVVLNVDPTAERFSLGVKQLSDDPWQLAVEKYPAGHVIKGEVIKVADFGIFVKVEDNIEGLVHISELSDEKVDNPADLFKPGETVEAVVLSMDPSERKMGLSVKAAKDQDAIKAIAENKGKQTKSKPTLGDLMGDSLRKVSKTPEEEPPSEA